MFTVSDVQIHGASGFELSVSEASLIKELFAHRKIHPTFTRAVIVIALVLSLYGVLAGYWIWVLCFWAFVLAVIALVLLMLFWPFPF